MQCITVGTVRKWSITKQIEIFYWHITAEENMRNTGRRKVVACLPTAGNLLLLLRSRAIEVFLHSPLRWSAKYAFIWAKLSIQTLNMDWIGLERIVVKVSCWVAVVLSIQRIRNLEGWSTHLFFRQSSQAIMVAQLKLQQCVVFLLFDIWTSPVHIWILFSW